MSSCSPYIRSLFILPRLIHFHRVLLSSHGGWEAASISNEAMLTTNIWTSQVSALLTQIAGITLMIWTDLDAQT